MRADPGRTYQAIRRVDLARSLPVRILFGVRRIPRWFASGPPQTMTLDDFVRAGFFILAEKPGVEIVLGVIGQFWRPAGAVLHVDPSEFASFERPGYAKAEVPTLLVVHRSLQWFHPPARAGTREGACREGMEPLKAFGCRIENSSLYR